MNELTQFNEGGSHEQNPLGGIPQGQNPQGGMNMVEEGESKFNDYIYSDRLIISKDLAEAFGLPKSYIDKSFSEASKSIDKKFKEREDNISNRTKEGMFNKLMEAQEALKEIQAPQQPQEGMEQGMEQQMPQGMGMDPSMMQQIDPSMMQQMDPNIGQGQMPQDQMFSGGGSMFTDIGADMPQSLFSEGAGSTASPTPSGGGPSIMGGLGAASTGLGMFQNMQNGTSSDPMSGAMSGAMAGASFGPWGAGAGALIGAGTSLIGNQKAKKNYYKALQKDEINESRKAISTFSKGGKMNTYYPDGGSVERPKISPVEILSAPGTFNSFSKPSFNSIPNTTYKGKKSLFGNVDWSNANKYASTAAMLAPAIANLTQNISSPEEVNPVLNSNRYNPSYMDDRTGLNQINDMHNSALRGVSESGASVGAMRNAILSGNLNRLQAMSGIYQQNRSHNAQQDMYGQQFNNANQEANIQRIGIAKEQNEMNRAAYRNAGREKRQAIAQNIADVGMYARNAELMKEMYGYNQFGEYMKAKAKKNKK